jgi:hypothetical protein
VASYVKFEQFVEDLAGKVHDLFGTAGSGADTCKVYLSNTGPTASTNAVKADLAEITNQNGYTAPVTMTNVGTRSGGTLTVNATNVTITASGGTVGPFQYVVAYNDTPTSPADPLIAYWNYGSALTLNDGESFTVKFNNGASNGTFFTLA